MKIIIDTKKISKATKARKNRWEKINERYNKLSLQEKLAFKELTKFKGMGIRWILQPFYIFFYLGIFGLVLLFAFDINLLSPLKIVGVLIFKFIWIFILLAFAEYFAHSLTELKRTEKLLGINKIKKEVTWKKNL